MTSTLTLIKEEEEEENDREQRGQRRLKSSQAFLCLLCSRAQTNESQMRKMECLHWCCVDCQEEAVRRARKNNFSRRDCLKCQQQNRRPLANVQTIIPEHHHHNELRFSLMAMCWPLE